ncbi:MAG: alkaline phosphatase family protein [Planctomycetaceae bacterium]
MAFLLPLCLSGVTTEAAEPSQTPAPATLESNANLTRHVLIIGLDGVREDALLKAETPQIDRLAARGTRFSGTLIRKPMGTDKADTVSGPGWSNLLTGVWPDKHNVLDNKFTSPSYKKYPHFFSRLKEARPDAFTASYCNWNPISETIVSQADINEYSPPVNKDYAPADVTNTDSCVKMLAEKSPMATVLYLGQIDETGHNFGFHPSVPQYMEAIERVDALIGRVLAAIEARPQRKQEQWLILVCTDHGGRGRNHGGGHAFPEITQTWMIVSGDGAQLNKEGKVTEPETAQVDVVATALTFLVGALPREWNLDGKPVGLLAKSEQAE